MHSTTIKSIVTVLVLIYCSPVYATGLSIDIPLWIAVIMIATVTLLPLGLLAYLFLSKNVTATERYLTFGSISLSIVYLYYGTDFATVFLPPAAGYAWTLYFIGKRFTKTRVGSQISQVVNTFFCRSRTLLFTTALLAGAGLGVFFSGRKSPHALILNPPQLFRTEEASFSIHPKTAHLAPKPGIF